MSDIEENNKLIAEFMELNIEKRYLSIKTGRLNKNISLDTYGTPILCYIYNKTPVFFSDLKFHSSWNWIMPVVEKIENSGAYVAIEKNSCEIDIGGIYSVSTNSVYGCDFEISIDKENKLKATYKAVIEFIKWYNENNKK